ncbi:hypothetical protein QYM36_006016, partial [Artemia franciscana]
KMRVEGVLFAISLVSQLKAFKQCAEDQDCPIGTVCNVSRNLCIIAKKNKKALYNAATRRYGTEVLALNIAGATPNLATQIPTTETTTTAVLNSDKIAMSPSFEDAKKRFIEIDVDTHDIHIPQMMLTLQNFYERLILLVGAIIILPIGIALGLPFLV